MIRLFFIGFLFISCTSSKRLATTYTTVILDGSKSSVLYGDGTGFIKSMKWRQIEGKTYSIDNPYSAQTQTKITIGSYAWELTGIDNLGNVGKDTFYYPKRK